MRLSLAGLVQGAASPVGAPHHTRLEKLALQAAAAATVTGVALQGPKLLLAPPHTALRPCRNDSRSKPKLSWLTVDAVSGAVGEIASLVVLFPLDTLKVVMGQVMCQARGASTGVVIRELAAMGFNARTLRTLYAGCGPSAVCSAAIGAVYLLAFYALKRAGTQLACQQQQQRRRRQPAGAAASQLGGAGSARPPLNSEGTHPVVASLAGTGASLVGSIFEAPMESFKLRAQAGALHGPMLHSMVATATTHGISSLYATWVGFLIKSIPFDVAELFTYSQLSEWRDAAAARRQRLAALTPSTSSGGGSAGVARGGYSPGWQEQMGDLLARAPNTTSDLLIGAAAGVASVLVSMPFDAIKTRLDLQQCTHVAAAAAAASGGGGGGALQSLRAFCHTGQQLVVQGGGTQALFVGLWPRLLQTLPSTMVYWAAVEATRRALTTHFDVDSSDGRSNLPASSSSTWAPQQQQVTPGAA